MKRWLFLVHRWLGLFGCVLILLWFGTGFVMMYVPYPDLLESERLEHAAPIAIDRVRIGPARALALARLAVPVDDRVERLRLIQSGPQPVYSIRFERGGWLGIDASSGEPLHMTSALASQVAEHFAGVPALDAQPVDVDQWSMQAGLDPHRPLWAVRMADGGVHYLSGRTGELLRDTSLNERAWNWVGSVVHWIYPTVLRREARVWHWVVIAASSYALAVAVLGTVAGLVRWRWRDAGRRSPYRGWMRWHHVLGLACAVFTLAWLTSGLLSMNPGEVFSDESISTADADAWRGASFEDADVRRALDASLPPTAGVPESPAVEIEWWPGARLRSAAPVPASSTEAPGGVGVRAGVLHGPREQRLWWREASASDWLAQSVGAQEIAERGARLGPPSGRPAVLAITRVADDDLYHYRRFEAAPPAWRVRLDDARATWLQVDARSGELLSRLDRSNRVQRWLYHGLHSWDLGVLLRHRPLWDALMLPALALGFVFSVTSVVIAVRRLAAMRRRAQERRAAAALHPDPRAAPRWRRLEASVSLSSPARKNP